MTQTAEANMVFGYGCPQCGGEVKLGRENVGERDVEAACPRCHPRKTYVTIDLEWQNELECYETAYAVESLGDRWNGWETPVVSRDVMDKIVHRQNFMRDDEAPFMSWDGNGVLVVESGVEESWLMPDAVGNFDLAPLGWCWVAVEPETNVIRRIG